MATLLLFFPQFSFRFTLMGKTLLFKYTTGLYHTMDNIKLTKSLNLISDQRLAYLIDIRLDSCLFQRMVVDNIQKANKSLTHRVYENVCTLHLTQMHPILVSLTPIWIAALRFRRD